jgi:hypothetical protein
MNVLFMIILVNYLHFKPKIMNTDVIPGGWTAYSTQISDEAKKAFETAFKGFVGVNYTPLAVATQVVAGTNYSFFCNAKGVYPGAINEGAMILIYSPAGGKPHIVSITRTPR